MPSINSRKIPAADYPYDSVIYKLSIYINLPIK